MLEKTVKLQIPIFEKPPIDIAYQYDPEAGVGTVGAE